jgi:DedD protein
MARAISDEELQLKRRARRRLIGAIVLVAAMVVVLPMVLDTEPRPVSQNISIRIPSIESDAFKAKVAPAPAAKERNSKSATPQAESKPAVTADASQEKEAPKLEVKRDAAKPAKAAPAKPPAKAQAKAPARTGKPAAKPANGPFVVQIIALADAAKAQQLQERITGAGIQSYTEIVKTVKGDVTRVRAGPFATREAAEKAREQLKSLGMNGNITTR